MGAPLPVNSLIVEDWFNGLYAALVMTTISVILTNRKHTLPVQLRLLAWVIVPFICSTLHTSLNWVYYANAIDDNELPGGPGLLFSLTHLAPWIEGAGDTFFCLNILLADCLFIWRCWILWGRKWIVVVLPIMATTTGAVLAGRIISDQVMALTTEEPFTVAKKSAEFVKLSTVYFCMSIATSLTTTALITLRILLVQRWSDNRKSPSKYRPVVEIIVESAALYSVTLLVFVALDITKNPNVFFAQNIHSQMAGIAPLLITLRVAAGFSRPQDEWSSYRHTQDIEFAPSNSTLEGTGTAVMLSQMDVTEIKRGAKGNENRIENPA